MLTGSDVTGEEEDDILALSPTKPVDRRRREARRRVRKEYHAAKNERAKPTPKVHSRHVTNEVRRLAPAPKKCPFLKKDAAAKDTVAASSSTRVTQSGGEGLGITLWGSHRASGTAPC